MKLRELDIKIRFFIDFLTYKIPLVVDIADIVEDENEPIVYDVNITNNGYEINKDLEVEFNTILNQVRLKKMIKQIYSKIDFESLQEMDTWSIFKEFNLHNENDFIYCVTNSDFFTVSEIKDIYNKITFYEQKVKMMFIKKAIDMFLLNKTYPSISLDEDNTMRFIKMYEEHFKYPSAMVEMQPFAEYPFSIWFKENIGKAVNEFSWRELEAKKIYLTSKTNIDGFKELVKSKAMENSRKEK